MTSTDTTTAIQFDQERNITLVELPLPTIAADEVLVRSRVIGLCRSDIELLEGHLDSQLGIDGPVVPGHEWCGDIAAVGDDVTGLTVGDAVVGECVLAPNSWFGFDYPGAGSTYFRAPARLIHKLTEGITHHQGALIEPFTIAYKGMEIAGGCTADDTVVIVGAGMVGLAAVSIAAAHGSTTVVIEPSATRRALAADLGATHTVDPSGTTVDQTLVEKLTKAHGADLVIEASGSAPGLASTLALAAHGGRVLNIGINTDPNVSAPLGLIQAKDLTVFGTTGSAAVWPSALDFMERHAIKLDGVITATYPLDRIHDAIDATNDPANTKVHVEL